MPTILVASPHLGGISTTISAYESLRIRGYDVEALLCFEDNHYENWRYFEAWSAERGIPLGVMRLPPVSDKDRMTDMTNMLVYYDDIGVTSDRPELSIRNVIRRLRQRHQERWKDLSTTAARARSTFWWPFVQHAHVTGDSDVMVIDSAHGDTFEVYSHETAETTQGRRIGGESSSLVPTFDGSASWWTQCFGHANPDINLAAANAAGQYGHVIFPQAAQKPALELAESLISSVGRGWASRAFFSDDGSTGMEVAIKMGLHKAAKEYRASKPSAAASDAKIEFGILGLKGSYHGDTIGAMDASEPSVYSRSVEWYRGRGFWLEPPTVRIEQGEAVIRMDGEQWEGNNQLLPPVKLNSLQEVYDVDGRIDRRDPLAGLYRNHIEQQLSGVQDRHGFLFGSLVLEPVLMGAGGMAFVDPLFQRILVDYARAELGLPVIFDEVFAGLHRLGRLRASSLLGVKPDIACFAKILTGGLVPMSVTLASEDIFRSYLGEQKSEALLHGHSYTAHPIGCAVANKTLAMLSKHDIADPAWNEAKAAWSSPVNQSGESDKARSIAPFSLWSKNFVDKVSGLPGVDGAMALGTVLVVYLRDGENSGKSYTDCRSSWYGAKRMKSYATTTGYQSTASTFLLKQLRHPTSAGTLAIHARPLGNTVYWMSSLTTPPETLREVEQSIWRGLATEEVL